MKKIAIILLCLTALIFGFQATKDTDFGWHYRCGKELLTGHPCLDNHYSYFLPDYKAYYPSFVYDTVLAVGYDHFGFSGLSLINSVILLFCVICLYQLIKGPFWLKVALPLLVLFTPGPSITIGLRPQVFTFLFFLLTLKIGEISLKNYKYLYLLPLLFAFWVNTHIGFIAGILLLPGLFLNHPLPKKWPVILPFFMAFLATFLNPFGPKVYLEIFRHLQAPLSTTIAEWVAPPLWLNGLMFFLVLELILLLAVKKQLTLSPIINLLIFTILACLGFRNLIFLSTLMAIYLSSLLRDKKFMTSSADLSPRFPRPNEDDISAFNSSPQLNCGVFLNAVINDSFSIPAILICLVIFSKNVTSTAGFNLNWENYCTRGQIPYPCEFIIKYPDLKGNIFATYEWGGFLIWKMPNMKVFADGRTPAWLDNNGKSTYEILLAIVQAQRGWNEKLSETGTNYILIGPGTFLDLTLNQNPRKYNWKELYRDNVAVLYTKI